MKRRTFTQSLTLLPFFLRSLPFNFITPGKAQIPSSPQFFLFLYLDGGADVQYMFDARPQSFTQAGLIHNYPQVEPILFNQQVLANPAFAKLTEFQNDFSIINGVHSFPDQDGHEDNLSFLNSGIPAGGESFLSYLKGVSSPTTVDQIQLNRKIYLRNGGTAGNLSSELFFDRESYQKLIQSFQGLSEISIQRELLTAQSKIYQLHANGLDIRSQSARLLGSSVTNYQQTVNTITKLSPVSPIDTDKPHLQYLEILKSLYQSGFCNSVMYTPDFSLDAHGADQMRESGKTYSDIAQVLYDTFHFFKNTSIDGNNSLLSQTTILIGSEFSRTMRQLNVSIENTGTDHNPLNGTFLLAGKGIKGGLAIGASDFISPEEELSKAHLQKDPEKIKLMGRPFDFTQGIVRSDLPSEFISSDYISMSNVVNTLMTAMGIPSKASRYIPGTRTSAPLLTKLLA